MADLAASDVTYTLQGRDRRVNSRYNATFKVAFGDGALTYPANGIPLDKSKFGCPNVVESLTIIDPSDGDGLVWKYDFENNKLRAWMSPARTHAHDLLIKGGQASSTTNNTAHYATDILGKEAATDATIAGSASATKGGVISSTLAASAGTEHGNTAPAATVLYIEVLGW